MNLRQLSYFVRIIELQSLSKAAAVLRVAQPALSRQMRALELDLGTDLLVRHGWGVTPTPAGQVLADHARRLLRETQVARDAVTALSAEPAGSLSFGVSSSLALPLLPRLSAWFLEHHPKVSLQLLDGFSASIHGWVLSGRLDVAVLYEDRSPGPLVTTPLLREPILVVGAAGRLTAPVPVSAGDLGALPMILPARPNRLRLLLDQLRIDHGLELNVRVDVDSLPALLEMVRSGQGYTLLPYSAVQGMVTDGRLTAAPLDPPVLNRTLVMVRPLDRVPTAATDILERAIRRIVVETAPALRWEPLV
ncbi:LysR family transcriptional regulator [Niveispirillum fermenti]|uniref:LysR family transcriptional regulator n=1 Tax=Niveispirillum fermenti TaxID=1233113 RepID=UPI0040435264